MWPFSKGKKQSTSGPNAYDIVLCIPGNWLKPEDFIISLVASSNVEYTPVGGLLINANRKTSYSYEIHDYDEDIKQAFEYAGLVTHMKKSEVEEVAKHKTVVYLYGPIGGLDEAFEIALAGAAILKAGGIAIKVETAGKAFTKESWIRFTENFSANKVYKMFVVDSIADSHGAIYSCGMKNIGLKDFIIVGEELQNSVDVISLIANHQIANNTTFKSGEEISIDAGREVYTINSNKYQPYSNQSLLSNPFGMWKLQRL